MSANDARLTTDYPIDVVAGYQTGSVSVGAASSIAPVIAHGLGYTPLYFLKWSTTPDFSISFDEVGVTFNFIQLSAQTDSTNLYLFALNITSSSQTLYYRVIYFMPTNININAPGTQLYLDDSNLNSDYNYTKIYEEGLTGGSSATVAHNLGYYPQVEAWYIRSSDSRCVHCVEGQATGNATPIIVVTPTEVQFINGSSTSASNWHYKIYADEV